MAVDDEYVYFVVNKSKYEVRRVSKCGGETVMLAPSGGTPANIVVDEDSVYWSEAIANGSVFKVPKGGGPRVTLAAGQPSPRSLAVDGERICWGSNDAADIRCVLAGGGPVTIAANVPHLIYDLHPFEGYFYWTSQGDSPMIGRVKQAGGDLTEILEVNEPMGMLVDCEHIYSFIHEWGVLDRMPSVGGPLESFAESVSRFAQDGETVFWTYYYDGSVSSRSKLGGPVKEIAGGLGKPHHIAIDATHVYWTDAATNAVMAAPR